MKVNPFGDNIPPRYLELQGELIVLERDLDRTRDWYALKLMESTDSLTKTMDVNIERLTASTEALATTANRQADATRRLEDSSNSLNRLTAALLVLTAVLAVAGVGSYTLQVAGESGLHGTQAVVLTAVTIMIVIAFIFIALDTLTGRAARARPNN